MIDDKIILTQTDDKTLYFLDFEYTATVDRVLAQEIDMTREEFQNYLIQNFNAILNKDINETYFKNKKDGKKAIEWYDSVRLIIKLANV